MLPKTHCCLKFYKDPFNYNRVEGMGWGGAEGRHGLNLFKLYELMKKVWRGGEGYSCNYSGFYLASLNGGSSDDGESLVSSVPC